MLIRPSECRNCPLDSISTGFMRPNLANNGYGVALIGEALGKDEADQGKPFVGKAGFRLARMLQWAGLDREKFDIYNTVWCRPPDNKLEGEQYELPSIAHCKQAHWGALTGRSKVLVPLGNVPMGALIGRKGILGLQGYVFPGDGQWIIPAPHPSFIQRGQAKWSAAFINTVQKAVKLAADGMPPQVTSYVLDPSPLEALRWAQDYRAYLQNNPRTRLAFDIETPGKPEDDDEVDVDSDAPDRTWNIERISFAYRPLEAVSFPWAPEYMAAVKWALEGSGELVVWNAGFDVPRLQRCGVNFGGPIHDGMVAWHILHSDLPKSLRFVATFTCPWQPAWKHLSGSKPAFYNATDSDVEARSMTAIEDELKRVNLWGVYERDVLQLDPILVHMTKTGMPVDPDVRLDRAIKLAGRLTSAYDTMVAFIPEGARKIEKVFVNTPKCTDGLRSRPGERTIQVCSSCGLERPPKNHFRVLKKSTNPCSTAQKTDRIIAVDEWYRLADWTPSRDQLVRYHQFLKRPLPMVYDSKNRRKKVSFGEEQLRLQMLKYPDDGLYGAILEWRGLQKLASTYIGYPED
jgi:uracil-DNA glycosylase family 4